MNTFSLDELRESIDNEFAPVVITHNGIDFILKNILRISKERRQLVADALDKLDGTSESIHDITVMEDAVTTVLTTVAEPAGGTTLVKAIGDDFALSMKIVELWVGASEAPEAQSSLGGSTDTESISCETSTITIE